VKDAPLVLLLEHHGSDKTNFDGALEKWGWAGHHYATTYSLLFQHRRRSIRRVFEVGIGTTDERFPANMTSIGSPGASLRAWRDFFPNAEIFGGDIDSNSLFQEPGISTFFCDQTDPHSISSMKKLTPGLQFDLIVDDGLHEFHAGVTFFREMSKMLSEDGVYVIEDVNWPDLHKYLNCFKKSDFIPTFVTANSSPGKISDDTILILQRK
jgi:SAM-dependent methyltransferase